MTKTLVMYTSLSSDGTPALFAVDKATGEQLGKVEVEEQTRYGNMTYVHKGRQYVVLQTGAKLTVLALPDENASGSPCRALRTRSYGWAEGELFSGD